MPDPPDPPLDPPPGNGAGGASTPDAGPRPWRDLGSEEGPDLIVARARFDTLENPRTGVPMRRVVLRVPDWVNVCALTERGELVLVRQYRFGSRETTVEIPGGLVDPGEAPLDAARRELREETGYTAASWEPLGDCQPNPAIHDNVCHHWLARGARRTHDQDLDGGEDIAVELRSLDAVRDAIRTGEIRHSLVLAALCRLLDLRGPRRP